ncbi:hypothetical protein R2F61_09365 [Mollicutes bacterium LVI A0078]|nr:hypothetical protein R2F61_09365 [Mollicutes bacterium LVI A0078]
MNNNTSQAKISDNKKKFDKSKNFDKSKRRKFSDEEKKYRISIIDAMQPEKNRKIWI